MPALNHQPSNSPAGYDALPESIRAYISPREYLWLSDAEKARLLQDETEPDPEP